MRYNSRMDAPPPEQDAQPEIPPDLPKSQVEFFLRAAEKVRTQFPDTPRVYLFQDKLSRVIYIGKANNLRARRFFALPM